MVIDAVVAKVGLGIGRPAQSAGTGGRARSARVANAGNFKPTHGSRRRIVVGGGINGQRSGLHDVRQRSLVERQFGRGRLKVAVFGHRNVFWIVLVFAENTGLAGAGKHELYRHGPGVAADDGDRPSLVVVVLDGHDTKLLLLCFDLIDRGGAAEELGEEPKE